MKESKFLTDLRAMKPRQALEHIWYYYRWWILSAVFLAVFLSAVIPKPETRQKVGACLIQDSLYGEGEAFAAAALTAAGLSPEGYYVDFSSLIISQTPGVPDAATQTAIAVAADTADAVICSAEVLEQLRERELFLSEAEGGILEITSCFEGDVPVYLCLLKHTDLPQGISALISYGTMR